MSIKSKDTKPRGIIVLVIIVIRIADVKIKLVHGQVTIIFVVSVCLCICLFVCLFVCAEFFSAVFDPIWIKLGCYTSGSSCVP